MSNVLWFIVGFCIGFLAVGLVRFIVIRKRVKAAQFTRYDLWRLKRAKKAEGKSPADLSWETFIKEDSFEQESTGK